MCRRGHFPDYKLRECDRCKRLFKPLGSRQKYCLDCREKVRRERNDKAKKNTHPTP